MKKYLNILLITLAFVIMGAINVYAVDETNVEEKVDTVPPVFNSIAKTRYTVKKADEEKEFVPEEVFGNITATDNVDGNNVTVSLAYNGVDLSEEGEYQVMYTATDKAGNISYMILVITVDGMAPTFDSNIETLYYMNKDGMIFDSKHNAIPELPKTLIAKEAVGAYKGIGVYLTKDLNGNIVFVDVIKNTPAENVLFANDILVAIDGENIQQQSQEYVAKKIKGEPGTTVQLDLIRNGQNISVTAERQLIKLYGEIDCIATPNVDLTSINEKNGTVEITYTATDEAGNTSEFVITVIIIEDEEDKLVENENGKESEDLYNVTTSGNPPEGINLNIDDVEKVEEDAVVEKNKASQEKTVEEIANEDIADEATVEE